MTPDCPCLTGHHYHADFDERMVGVDGQSGRFGEVSLQVCRHCGRSWLRYFWEDEARTASGRWGRGLVSSAIAASITPQSALRTLEQIEFYFVGGSYFGGEVRQVSGPGWL